VQCVRTIDTCTGKLRTSFAVSYRRTNAYGTDENQAKVGEKAALYFRDFRYLVIANEGENIFQTIISKFNKTVKNGVYWDFAKLCSAHWSFIICTLRQV
jgi:hypothetical protein